MLHASIFSVSGPAFRAIPIRNIFASPARQFRRSSKSCENLSALGFFNVVKSSDPLGERGIKIKGRRLKKDELHSTYCSVIDLVVTQGDFSLPEQGSNAADVAASVLQTQASHIFEAEYQSAYDIIRKLSKVISSSSPINLDRIHLRVWTDLRNELVAKHDFYLNHDLYGSVVFIEDTLVTQNSRSEAGPFSLCLKTRRLSGNAGRFHAELSRSTDLDFKIFEHLFTSLSDYTPSSASSFANELSHKAFEIADNIDADHDINEVVVILGVGQGHRSNLLQTSSTKTRLQCGGTDKCKLEQLRVMGLHRAFIALGSNMGDRTSTLEAACRAMQERGLKVKRTSSLFESVAMYVTDQATFLNAVCEIETTLEPLQLLDELQAIENSLGRVRVVDKGPRTLDLDIILYDNVGISNERLTVPHKLMLERQFVLQPLDQLIPFQRLPAPYSNKSVRAYHNDLTRSTSSAERPVMVTPLAGGVTPLTPLDPFKATHIMAVLNVTPDSFSDGSVHDHTNPISLTETVRHFVHAGATILDIGGQSTRPHATRISEQDELARIIPVIRHIRQLPEANHVAISVDTFYARVAHEASEAGADIVNDVSAGTLDDHMLATMAKIEKTVVLMHMRGTPETMNKLTEYPEGIIVGVGKELLARVKEAEVAGVRRWRIVLDPGIGFAKTQAQNLELLRRFDELRTFGGLEGFPWLVGASRKGFIGRITGVEKASERGWGTAAAVTASIKGGADIVRVHDVPEMTQVARMADAIFRVDTSPSTTDTIQSPP